MKRELFAVAIAGMLIIGCDKKDTAADKVDQAQNKMDQAADKMDNADTPAEMQKAQEMAKEKMKEANQKMDEAGTKAKEEASNKMTDMKMENAADAAKNASGTMTAQVQKLMDQAKEYMANNNIDGAQGVIDKLDSMKDKLPADWQTKIDGLKASFDKMKGAAGK